MTRENHPLLRLLTLAGSIAAGATLGCSTNDPSPWQLRALTFNAALAPGFEPRSNERLPAVVSALQEASQTLDVLCVQELWVESDFARLTDATADTLPSVVHPAPLPGAGACTQGELGTLGGCVQTACGATGPDDRVGCIQSQCASEVGSLSGGCLGCLINHLDDFSSCARRNDAPTVSDPAIFGGDYDTGLLSRYPISARAVLALDAYFQRGAVLYARVDVPQLGPVHAFCTHLSSALGVIPYAGRFGSWENEHRREVEQLLQFVHDKAGDREPILVMGDLNTGMASDDSVAVLPEHFEALLGSGLRDPYLDSGQPQCSECNDDTLHAPDTPNDRIDHVLIERFPSASARVTRAFTTPMAIVAGAPVSHLSDHYGIRLDLASR